MKTTASFILMLLLFCIKFPNYVNAQTPHLHDHTNYTVTLEDIQNIQGFDENAVLAELQSFGVKGEELQSALHAQKIAHIKHQKEQHGEKSVIFPPVSPSAGPCDNAGFENGNFTNWQGATGKTNIGSWTPGIVNAGNNSPVANTNSQHTLHTTPGFDPNAINTTTGVAEIPYIAPNGSGVSCRLGNSAVLYGMEELRYQITVTPSNTSFTYQYAVVLQDPGHSAGDQPSFNIKVLDQNGVQVPGSCGYYSVNATNAATDPTFFPFDDPATSFTTIDGYYKKWTTITIDLTSYISNTMTIVFETKDCNLGGHYGYAYIDAFCNQLQATVDFCPNDTALTLTAPIGFTSYQWYNNNVLIPGATDDTLVIQNPVLGQSYNVTMLSASGCGSSLTVTLGYSNMSLLQGVTNVKCHGDNDGLAHVHPSGASGPYTYSWVDAATGQIVNQTDSLLNASAGTYYVTVWSKGGCSVTDTITITEPANPIDSLEINTVFCPGDPAITLYAPSGYIAYTWYAGNDANGTVIGNLDSIIVNNPIPGSEFYVELHNNPPACNHFLSLTLNYQPPAILPDYIVKTNVFTPDGNGVNDLFNLAKFNYIKEFSVEVYNRWGKKIFESTDLNNQWDGKINGNEADAGVYFWIATYKSSCVDNAPIVKNTGFVHLLR